MVEVFQTPKPSKEMLEGVDALAAHLGKFMDRGHGQRLQSEGEGLCFVDAMVSGVKVVSLVDISTTHSFVSERTTKSLHCKPESSTTTYKVVNSTVEPMVGVVHSAPLRVGSWFGNWDLTVAPLDDHALVLGK
jgi:hypothetical protein